MTARLPAVLLAASALTICAWYGGVYRPAENIVAERDDEATGLRAQIARDRALATRAGTIANAAAALAERLRVATQAPSAADALDRFFADLGAVADRHALAIRTIVPATPGVDDGVPLDLTVRGPYTAVIAAVRDLAARHPTARIAVASLRFAQRLSAQQTAIDATLHVTLLRA
jgi:hypothetical protein